ncbi:hypothetical protein [Dankookia sp. P2]|uniref:hypothetical protein n=1 Tax=Dankookia sp. P2 TaxID=3423955 RepID=UPI003D66DE61
MPLPDFASFSTGLAAGHGQVLWRERVADLDTPVGTFLKLAHGKPNSFLLESIEGAPPVAAIPPSGWSRT